VNLVLYAILVGLPTALLVHFRFGDRLNKGHGLLYLFSAVCYGAATFLAVWSYYGADDTARERFGNALNRNTDPAVCCIGDEVEITVAQYFSLRELLTISGATMHDCEAVTKEGLILPLELQVVSWRDNDLYPYSNLHTTDHTMPTKAYVRVQLPSDERYTDSTVSFQCEGNVKYLARRGNSYYTAAESFATNVSFVISSPAIALKYSHSHTIQTVWFLLGLVSGLLCLLVAALMGMLWE
jgi:hypothetical protein